MLRSGPRRWRELDVDAQLVSGEQEVLEHRRRLVFVGDFDEDAERKEIVNHGLTHVQDRDVVFGQNFGQPSREAGLVLAGDVDQNDFAHG